MFFKLRKGIRSINDLEIEDTKRIYGFLVSVKKTKDTKLIKNKLNKHLNNCISSFVFKVQGVNVNFICTIKTKEQFDNNIFKLTFNEFFAYPINLINDNQNYFQFTEELFSELKDKILNDDFFNKLNVTIIKNFRCYYSEKNVSELSIPKEYNLKIIESYC